MAKTVNECHLLGRAGKDADVRTSKNGKPFAKFSIATDGGTGKDGREFSTNWHNCIAFGDELSEIASGIRKGAEVEVSGRIQYGSYEKDGVKRYTTDIVCTSIEVHGREDSRQTDRPRQYSSQPSTEVTDEDLPF